MARPLPPEVAAEIKAIMFQDYRERTAAGYVYLSYGLFKRLAAYFGVSVHTVESIRYNRRRAKVRASEAWAYRGLTVDRERLAREKERLTRERERLGLQVRPRPGPRTSTQHRGKKPA
jgi:hypothetical protein